MLYMDPPSPQRAQIAAMPAAVWPGPWSEKPTTEAYAGGISSQGSPPSRDYSPLALENCTLARTHILVDTTRKKRMRWMNVWSRGRTGVNETLVPYPTSATVGSCCFAKRLLALSLGT